MMLRYQGGPHIIRPASSRAAAACGQRCTRMGMPGAARLAARREGDYDDGLHPTRARAASSAPAAGLTGEVGTDVVSVRLADAPAAAGVIPADSRPPDAD